MQTKHIITGIAAAALMLPVAASAQSASVEVQVKSILSQIQALQMQLKTLLASTTPMVKAEYMTDKKAERPMMPPGQMGKEMCIMLKRDLRTGSQGEDVKQLQELLAQDPAVGFRGQATGFYGPLTANAMAKFQMRMGIASTTEGTVGPMTRGFFERACGMGLGNQIMDMHRAEVAGTISASANSSITVQMKDGNTRIVNVVASTSIQVYPSTGAGPSLGTIADLTVGKMIKAEGAPQADGSLTARQIRVGIRE